ncbi:MAG: fasciclin domain-containing protein [Arcticibacter sp.]
MKRSIRNLLCFLTIVLLFSNCRKQEWDDYYGRPNDLAAPIYQQLKAKGQFNTLLSVIDKSGYKEILGNAGAWTLFAPTDAAFTQFFQERGISGVDQMDTTMARKIALYGLVYNPYRKDQLTTFQTSAGGQQNAAFRRRTAYYDFVYTENGRKVVDNNRNGVTTVVNDNNNKYLPYYIDSYLSSNGLATSDYSALYGGKTFSGFNVGDAQVIEADVPAENGVIHVVDRVLFPLPNIEQHISSNPEYSEFKKLLDRMVSYIPSADYTQRYRVLSGLADQVYIKTYDPALAFSPVNEGYLAATATDGQSASWSIAVPTNQAVKDYMKVLLENFGSIENAPPSVILSFLNSHMWTGTLWPSQLTATPNAYSEYPTFATSNVVERKALSNGNFYGLNKVQEANVFRTVYGKPYLDPKYALMNRAIDGSDLRAVLVVPSIQYTLFMISDTQMQQAGFSYNTNTGQWGYTAPGVSVVYDATSLARLNRFVQTSVLKTPADEFGNLAGEGVAETYNGEYVKFKNQRVYGSGNIEDNTFVTVDSVKTAVNGRVYYTTGNLKFAENNVTPGSSLEKLARSTDPAISNKFSHFFDFVVGSSLWKASDKSILGVDAGSFYTLFVPTNEAIEDAVKAGMLPGDRTSGKPLFVAAQQTQAFRNAVERFISYAIINKTTVAADGKKTGNQPTLLKDNKGDSRLLQISYQNAANPMSMEVKDDSAAGTKATINYSFSNNLTNRALIHSINKVLNF